MSEENKAPSPRDVLTGQIPIWMDASFFQKALREGGDDPQIRIVKCDVKEALGKGENYVSIVYRALVKDDHGKEHQLIVKCLPSNETRKNFSNKGDFFRKEIDMYKIVFPAYEKLRKGKNTPHPWARHYFSIFDRDYDYLVLEDLKVAGFTMRDRRKGLDRNHVEAALSALATYHAHSYVMKLTEPEAFQKIADLFPDTVYGDELRDLYLEVVRNFFDSIAANVRKYGGPRYEKIASKMLEWKETDFDMMPRLLLPAEPGALLTHGDFWVNNMMFKYRDSKEAETGIGKPVEVKLLDFQLVRYSSLATDLSYFMVSSMDTKTRREHWNDLLENAYLKNFWQTLESFGVQDKVQKGLFTIDWLKEEMKRLQRFAFMAAVTINPFVQAQADDSPDLDSLTEEEIKRPESNRLLELSNGTLFLERFRDLVDEFEENGLFD